MFSFKHYRSFASDDQPRRTDYKPHVKYYYQYTCFC